MFTGIIQEIGILIETLQIDGGRHLTIDAAVSARELSINDSVSVNGVCQTVIQKRERSFTVEAVEETLKKTTLGELQPSSRINIELPMKISDRIGGHLVQGHVDGIGVVKQIVKKQSSWLVTVEFPVEFARYVIPIGSIAIDGVSLTVATLQGNYVTISIIPHTLEMTTFSEFKPGRRVNLEFDLIGKFVERLMNRNGKPSESVTEDKLKEWGY
ncbi:MAG: riboflavin synthase [Ignavibacteriae bacterium]|nr:riboflavin synthase [Ignavibacteriota bacterium]